MLIDWHFMRLEGMCKVCYVTFFTSCCVSVFVLHPTMWRHHLEQDRHIKLIESIVKQHRVVIHRCLCHDAMLCYAVADLMLSWQFTTARYEVMRLPLQHVPNIQSADNVYLEAERQQNRQQTAETRSEDVLSQAANRQLWINDQEWSCGSNLYYISFLSVLLLEIFFHKAKTKPGRSEKWIAKTHAQKSYLLLFIDILLLKLPCFGKLWRSASTLPNLSPNFVRNRYKIEIIL